MRHLFVTQDYPPDSGGMARRHVELARRYPDEMEVSTVAPAPDESAAAHAFDQREPYPIHRQPFPFRRANRFASQVRWGRWLVRHAASAGVELLHCGNLRPAGYPVWWARHRLGVPYLLYVNGLDVLLARDKARANVVKRTAMRMIYEGAAGIVANSAFTACLTSDAMAEARVTRAPPLAAIDLGTDPAHFHPGRDDGTLRKRFGFGDAPLMLTVARLVPHKGQDTAIAVLATLRDRLPALRYLVVGSGGDKARLARMAEQLGVSDRVVFAGQLSDDDIAQAYATATVYVGLSRVEREVNVEGFGISFVEAAASGTPSVAGDSGGVSAAVRDGEMGFLVPPTDVAVAANAVARLVASPELRAWMGDAARQAVETHYNWDRVARETAAFADTVSR